MLIYCVFSQCNNRIFTFKKFLIDTLITIQSPINRSNRANFAVRKLIEMKLQDTINSILGEVKQNVEVAKEQLTATISEVKVAAQEEVEAQKNALSTYKERFNSLKAKGFNKNEILEDVKGEVAFFGNELSSVLNRNVDKFKSIVAPKIESLKNASKKAAQTAEEVVEGK